MSNDPLLPVVMSPHELGMPLDGADKAPLGHLDGLDDPVIRNRCPRQAISKLANSLVMPAVDADRLFAQQMLEVAALKQGHMVRHTVEGWLHEVRAPCVVLAGKVLVERTSQGDVDRLHATADAKDGQIPVDRTPDEGDLELVKVIEGRIDLGERLFSVGRGIYVDPSGDKDTVHEAKQPVNVACVIGQGQHKGQAAAGSEDGKVPRSHPESPLVALIVWRNPDDWLHARLLLTVCCREMTACASSLARSLETGVEAYEIAQNLSP